MYFYYINVKRITNIESIEEYKVSKKCSRNQSYLTLDVTVTEKKREFTGTLQVYIVTFNTAYRKYCHGFSNPLGTILKIGVL